MLFAVFPFLAATVLYWISCADLFGGSPADVPTNWTTRLFLPILTGSLAPLTAAATPSIGADDLRLLLSATAIGLLFSIGTAAALRGESAYFDLQLPVASKRWRLRGVARWHVVRYLGVVVMIYGCVATLFAVS